MGTKLRTRCAALTAALFLGGTLCVASPALAEPLGDARGDTARTSLGDSLDASGDSTPGADSESDAATGLRTVTDPADDPATDAGPDPDTDADTGTGTPAPGAPASPAAAARVADGVIEVTSGDNDGPGTLREAIETANATPDTETTITFSAAVPVVNLTASLSTYAPLTIRGNGQDSTEVRFTQSDTSPPVLLQVNEVALHIDSLTLTGVGEGLVGLQMFSWSPYEGSHTLSKVRMQGFGRAGIDSMFVEGTDLTVTESTFADNGVGIYLLSYSDAAVTVTDSLFEHNTVTGIEIDSYTPGTSAGLTIERTDFIGNGEMEDDFFYGAAGGMTISGRLWEAAPGASPVRIIDSTFRDNMGRAGGALAYAPWWSDEELSDTPRILVSGSTFVGNIGGEVTEGFDAGASAIVIEPLPMSRARVADAETEFGFSMRLENSTFDGSAAAAAGKSSALLADAFGGHRFELDHVTAVSSTLDMLGFGPGDAVSINRSVIDSAGADPVTPPTDPRDEPHSFTVSDSVFTQTSASVDLEAGSSQVLPLASLQLGALADNGGRTLTQLPADSSPLVDAVTAPGSLTVDQRGLARPVGAAADIGAVELQRAPDLLSMVSVLENVTVANGDTAVFRVERSASGAADELPEASVRIRTSDGTAKAGTDYEASEATLTWAAGETGVKTFSVPTQKRSAPLGERTFTVTLSEPSDLLAVVKPSAEGILPALDGATTPPVTPPSPEPPVKLPSTGGEGSAPWLLAALLAVLAGAAVLSLRRRA